jgi:hypothetical protein
MNENKPITRREQWARDVEIDPRSVTLFEAETGIFIENDSPMSFVMRDLKRQAWVFCKQSATQPNEKGMDFNLLEFGEIKQAPKDKAKPKGPWVFILPVENPKPEKLGQTAFAVAVEYPYIWLVRRGVLEGDEEDKEIVRQLNEAAAQREAEMQRQLKLAAEQTKAAEIKDPVALIEQMAKEKGVTPTEILASINKEFNTTRESEKQKTEVFSEPVDKEDKKE